jgi:bifunctional non-homologous end joining protein LigD
MFRSGSSAFEIGCSEGTALRPRLWDTDGNCYMYVPGERSDDWQKRKLETQQEFVIGGYRPGSNGVDALLVGYYDDTGVQFAGKVRAGFVPHLRRKVFKALKYHHVDTCPFVDLPNPKSSRWGGGVTADEMREMQWVRPELVAQIRFVEWTAEGRLRHAAFLGLRSDKSAREVRRETNDYASS